jgi:hypothetical protein
MTISTISKVIECFRDGRRKIKPSFRLFGSIQYDDHNCRISMNEISISVLEIKERLRLKTRMGNFQRKRWNLGGIRGQYDLLFRNKIFYLVLIPKA